MTSRKHRASASPRFGLVSVAPSRARSSPGCYLPPRRPTSCRARTRGASGARRPRRFDGQEELTASSSPLAAKSDTSPAAPRRPRPATSAGATNRSQLSLELVQPIEAMEANRTAAGAGAANRSKRSKSILVELLVVSPAATARNAKPRSMGLPSTRLLMAHRTGRRPRPRRLLAVGHARAAEGPAAGHRR